MEKGEGVSASPGLLGSGSQTQLRKSPDMPRSERGPSSREKSVDRKSPQRSARSRHLEEPGPSRLGSGDIVCVYERLTWRLCRLLFVFVFWSELPRFTNYSGLPRWPMVKNLPANTGDTRSIPGSGRSPGEGSGDPLQCSCLGNPKDRGAWRATAHGLAKSRTGLRNTQTQSELPQCCWMRRSHRRPRVDGSLVNIKDQLSLSFVNPACFRGHLLYLSMPTARGGESWQHLESALGKHARASHGL